MPVFDSWPITRGRPLITMGPRERVPRRQIDQVWVSRCKTLVVGTTSTTYVQMVLFLPRRSLRLPDQQECTAHLAISDRCQPTSLITC